MINGIGRSIGRIAVGAIAVFLIGLWQGNPFVFLAIYGLGLAVWQVWQESRFSRWLDHAGDNDLTGRWSNMAQRVAARQIRDGEKNRRVETQLGRFRDLAENFPDGIVMLDEDRRIIWFNAAASAVLGLTPGDTGQPVANLIRHPDLDEHLDNGDEPLIIDSPVHSSVWISLQAVVLKQGRRILVAKDVTAHQSSEAARHDFVANASHELRSPLTVIWGYLDAMAADDELDGVWQKPVREMLRQATRMSDLLTDLMDLSRLDGLQMKAEFNPIDMSALVSHIQKEGRQLAGHDCDIATTADPDYILLGEQPEIVSIVSNLVANAVRYSGADRKVSISWTVDEKGGHLAVRDNGIGIPEDEIPRITERFYRVDKGRSREKGGTGLGLAIVRNALNRHDGHIEIQSKLDEGSVFICHFPATRIAPAAENMLAAS